MPNQASPKPDATWQVSKTIKPHQCGAIKLARLHGDRLLCVRYRESSDRKERITTVELIVDRAPIHKRKDDVVAFKIRLSEHALRQLAKAQGATYDPVTRMWRLPRRKVLRMGLRQRIAVSIENHP